MAYRTPTLVIGTHEKLAAGSAIWIGRGTKWWNQFYTRDPKTRIAEIEQYARWLATQPALLADIGELRGRTLKCYCKPDPCHGDLLAICADLTGMDRLNDYVAAIMRCYGPSCRSVALLCVPEQHRTTAKELVIRNRTIGKQRC